MVQEEIWLRTYRVENYCFSLGLTLLKDQVKKIFDKMSSILSPVFKEADDLPDNKRKKLEISRSMEATKKVLELIQFFFLPQ